VGAGSSIKRGAGIGRWCGWAGWGEGSWEDLLFLRR